MKMSTPSITAFICCSLTFFSISGNAQTDSTSVPVTAKKTYPPKLPAKYRWEQVVSFPGTVAYFPLKLVFKGVQKTIATVDKTHIIQRIDDWMEADNGRYNFEPTYNSRTGGGLRFHLNNVINSGSQLTLTGTVGTKQRSRVAMQLSDIDLFAGLKLYGSGDYEFLSEEAFFGTGPETRESDEMIYGYQRGLVDMMICHDKGPLHLAFRSGLEMNKIRESTDDDDLTIFDLETLPAGAGDYNRLGFLGAELRLDSRDHAGQPHRGHELLVHSQIYDDVDEHAFGFWRLRADFSQYVHLFYHRTLAVRVAGQMIRPYGGRLIPFFHLSELGYRETVRGFERGRFYDRDRLFASAEYRFPIKRNDYEKSGYDGLLFIDTGQVSPSILTQTKFDRFKFGIGGGIRIYSVNGASMRLEIAFSDDGFRSYFILN